MYLRMTSHLNQIFDFLRIQLTPYKTDTNFGPDGVRLRES